MFADVHRYLSMLANNLPIPFLTYLPLLSHCTFYPNCALAPNPLCQHLCHNPKWISLFCIFTICHTSSFFWLIRNLFDHFPNNHITSLTNERLILFSMCSLKSLFYCLHFCFKICFNWLYIILKSSSRLYFHFIQTHYQLLCFTPLYFH